MQTRELYDLIGDVSRIFTDTRKPIRGGTFVALSGPSFDGNVFAKAALDAGALYAVVSQKDEDDDRIFLVNDTLVFLQNIARFHRRQFDIPVLAITGSNGKTTTKELLAAVLSQKYNVHFTKGNFNNHIGVPLTLLAMPSHTEIAIIEMGANHQGEIADLCEIAEPTHGLITNIGKAHLEGFGGIEGVKKGKGELFAYLADTGGHAFLRADDQYLLELHDHYSLEDHSTFYGSLGTTLYSEYKSVVPTIDSATYIYGADEPLEIQSALMGEYNLRNIEAAIAVGLHFEVALDDLTQAISSYRPDMNRSEIRRFGEIQVLLDAYNANPTSMKEAIAFLKEHPAKQKLFVLGDMLELGTESTLEHQAIYELVKNEQAVFVGSEFKRICQPSDSAFVELNDAIEFLSNYQFEENTIVLLKGSRGIGLEQCLRAFESM